MRKLRETVRLRLHSGISLRQTNTSLRLSLGAVQKTSHRIQELKLDWPAVEALDEQALAIRIAFPSVRATWLSFKPLGLPALLGKKKPC